MLEQEDTAESVVQLEESQTAKMLQDEVPSKLTSEVIIQLYEKIEAKLISILEIQLKQHIEELQKTLTNAFKNLSTSINSSKRPGSILVFDTSRVVFKIIQKKFGGEFAVKNIKLKFDLQQVESIRIQTLGKQVVVSDTAGSSFSLDELLNSLNSQNITCIIFSEERSETETSINHYFVSKPGPKNTSITLKKAVETLEETINSLK